MTIIIAAVLSFSIVETGYAYWDMSQAGDSKTTTSDNVNIISSGTADNGAAYFKPELHFNPSAKYFTYQVVKADGTIVIPTSLDLVTKDADLINEVSIVIGETPATDWTIQITGYTGNVTDIEIPASLTVTDGTTEVALDVTSVKGINSSSTVGLTSIAIPATVTSIGTNCFSGYRTTMREIRFAERTATLEIAAHAFRLSVGANTSVYYGDAVDPLANRAALAAVATINLATTTTFYGWQ